MSCLKRVTWSAVHQQGRGDVIDVQAEAHGFVEFETSAWLEDCCDVKLRIREAVDMVDAMDASTAVSTTAGVKTVEFPFDVKHLKTTKPDKGSAPARRCTSRSSTRTWTAKIQAFGVVRAAAVESYVTEHLPGDAPGIIASATKTHDAANTAKLPDADLSTSLPSCTFIIKYVTQAQKWNTHADPLAKEKVSLMSRTGFASVYRHLLGADE